MKINFDEYANYADPTRITDIYKELKRLGFDGGRIEKQINLVLEQLDKAKANQKLHAREGQQIKVRGYACKSNNSLSTPLTYLFLTESTWYINKQDTNLGYGFVRFKDSEGFSYEMGSGCIVEVRGNTLKVRSLVDRRQKKDTLYNLIEERRKLYMTGGISQYSDLCTLVGMSRNTSIGTLNIRTNTVADRRKKVC